MRNSPQHTQHYFWGILKKNLSKDRKKTDKQILLYVRERRKRYLDDCFILWTRFVEELHHFHNILNSLHCDKTIKQN